MECHPWFEVSDRRKIRFRNVQIKVLLVFEQGRPLQVLTSFDNFDQFGPVSTSFNQFRPVSTSFDQFRPVLTSLDWFISLLITSKIQYFWGGSLLLPTSVIVQGFSNPKLSIFVWLTKFEIFCCGLGEWFRSGWGFI